jgi:hypothetical protein
MSSLSMTQLKSSRNSGSSFSKSRTDSGGKSFVMFERSDDGAWNFVPKTSVKRVVRCLHSSVCCSRFVSLCTVVHEMGIPD